jgi:UDP-glucose 4-epimerase
MRIVVTGATGNVGTSLVAALAGDERVTEIVGLARRLPRLSFPRTRWVQADVASSRLTDHFRDADAVIHLAWLIQPSRDEAMLEAVNVTGSRRVFEAAAEAGVRALVHASSIGAYSPGPSDTPVDESWPTDGTPTSFYARHKAAAERDLDAVEAAAPGLRVVRLRPALIFKREAASEIRRLFAGPFLPSKLMRPSLLPVLPLPAGLVIQAVHADDVGEAYRLAATRDVRGAFNIAAEPEVDGKRVAAAIGARPVTVPARLARALAAFAWHARLQPTSPDWIDLALGVPLLDCTRAREELGWAPQHDAIETVRELLVGLADRAGGRTPPLRRGDRASEIAAGIGGKPV